MEKEDNISLEEEYARIIVEKAEKEILEYFLKKGHTFRKVFFEENGENPYMYQLENKKMLLEMVDERIDKIVPQNLYKKLNGEYKK